MKLQLSLLQENFARYLIIESKNKEKPVTSLSPFVIEKQIESTIGTAKSVKKLNQRTNGPVNAHLIPWPSKAQNIQNLENI